MKMNLNNPAFLQSAGNAQAKECISFVTANGSPMIPGLSAIGNVTVVSTYNGVQTTQLLIYPNEVPVNVQSDPNTQVFLYGKITKLSCDPIRGSLNLITLDVTKAKSLTVLNCNTNQLTSLDLSANTALTSLNCGANQLTSLDLSANTALTSLYCDNNQLTSLDLSANTALTSLTCGANQLTSLDLSANTALTHLTCGANQLTSLDLSANTALTYLDCNDCTSLMLLDIQNTQELEGGTILDQSMANLTTLKVAGTSAWAYEQVESWLSDFAPDGGMIYVDDNTPQGVITEAQGKSWTVEYVGAA